jgi:hypothetical protein
MAAQVACTHYRPDISFDYDTAGTHQCVYVVFLFSDRKYIFRSFRFSYIACCYLRQKWMIFAPCDERSHKSKTPVFFGSPSLRHIFKMWLRSGELILNIIFLVDKQLFHRCLLFGKTEECALSEAKSGPRGSPSLPRVRGPANGGTASPSVALDLGHTRFSLN